MNRTVDQQLLSARQGKYCGVVFFSLPVYFCVKAKRKYSPFCGQCKYVPMAADRPLLSLTLISVPGHRASWPGPNCLKLLDNISLTRKSISSHNVSLQNRQREFNMMNNETDGVSQFCTKAILGQIQPERI